MERYAPALAAGAEGARFIGDAHAEKNALVRFRHGGRDVVLKAFRLRLRHRLDALRNPFSRWGSRALALRSTARERVRSEIECSRAFREAGFGTFEILEQPSRLALLYGFEEGRPLRALARERGEARSLAVRASADLGRRQAAARERDCRWLVHPAPRLQHVWVTPDRGLLYFDFEDRVNPSLRLDEALALELMDWLYYVRACNEVGDDATLAACCDAVGEAAITRMRHYAATRPRGEYSGSFRKRRSIVPEVERVLGLTG